MHIPSVPPQAVEQIRDAMKRPEGTLSFVYSFDGLFDPELGYGILLEVVTGAIIFRLERDPDLNLHFFHSSPGTGTRVANVDIRPLKGSTKVLIGLVWSPSETRLHLGDLRKDSEQLLTGVGKPSPRQFRVDSSGAICQVGDEGVQVMGISVFEKGRLMLQPTAIEAWNSTVQAIKILLTGMSPEGYIFEVISTNMTIVMLVTGFEIYCKRRFLELEGEGISPDFNNLAKKFFSSGERERGEIEAIIQEAHAESISATRKIVNQGRIDFQNYERCKLAFNKGYGIRFGEDIGVSNMLLEEVQRLITFRHKIVHLSPLLGMLNQEQVPPQEPIFPNRQYAEKAVNTFDGFIQGLHRATLRLRPRE